MFAASLFALGSRNCPISVGDSNGIFAVNQGESVSFAAMRGLLATEIMKMTITPKQLLKALAAATAVAALSIPIAADAAVPGQDQIRGTITAFNGKYDMHVRDNNGNIDDVMLHQGTIINPVGLSLQAGMRVTILGNQQGDTFNANEIDTPYRYVQYEAVYPYYWGGPYWGPGWGPGFWGARFGW
jgi:hypothetical protein